MGDGGRLGGIDMSEWSHVGVSKPGIQDVGFARVGEYIMLEKKNDVKDVWWQWRRSLELCVLADAVRAMLRVGAAASQNPHACRCSCLYPWKHGAAAYVIHAHRERSWRPQIDARGGFYGVLDRLPGTSVHQPRQPATTAT